MPPFYFNPAMYYPPPMSPNQAYYQIPYGYPSMQNMQNYGMPQPNYNSYQSFPPYGYPAYPVYGGAPLQDQQQQQ